jgi:lysophospholipase L1-like esterase
MNWETILSLGDSITYGARSYYGFPEICGSILEKNLQKKWNVINHSTNGFTTIDLVRSIDKHWANFSGVFPNIITVLIGTNDVKLNTKPEEFLIAYNLLILKLKLISVDNNIVLIKIPRLTNKVFYPYNFSMNEKIAEFNDIIEQIIAQEEVRSIEFNFLDDDFFDGVHLTAKGCANAALQLAKFILKDKGFENTADLP